MKATSILVFLTAVAAGVFAAPSAEPEAAQLETRDNCFYASKCSTSWDGKCETHCGSRGFSHMTRDGCGINIFAKKCCCIVK
ncbi:hypothetical protein QBC40DRAFT_252209 [Triangularia verruculosa]|uniref:Defensin n=1 Tax=Triangularia verruculosa TaxID=2587418 RepID=A0AAN6XL67_9PEZI|nr:hypothetical protein QBC40DRAFT_252209 [Triangularia verruculosa]